MVHLPREYYAVVKMNEEDFYNEHGLISSRKKPKCKRVSTACCLF